MEIIIVRVATSSHLANPRSGRATSFVRLSTEGHPHVRYLWAVGVVSESQRMPKVVSPPLLPIVYTPDSAETVLGGYAAAFEESGTVTAFLVNEHKVGKALAAHMGLLEGDWTKSIQGVTLQVQGVSRAAA